MKLTPVFALCFATAATALSILHPDQALLGDATDPEKYLIELSPGETRWVTEDQKWALRRVRSLSISALLELWDFIKLLPLAGPPFHHVANQRLYSSRKA